VSTPDLVNLGRQTHACCTWSCLRERQASWKTRAKVAIVQSHNLGSFSVLEMEAAAAARRSRIHSCASQTVRSGQSRGCASRSARAARLMFTSCSSLRLLAVLPLAAISLFHRSTTCTLLPASASPSTARVPLSRPLGTGTAMARSHDQCSERAPDSATSQPGQRDESRYLAASCCPARCKQTAVPSSLSPRLSLHV
jgi:hypothetical protein